MDFGESANELHFRKGEAPVESRTAAEMHGSAGAVPTHFHNRMRRHAVRVVLPAVRHKVS